MKKEKLTKETVVFLESHHKLIKLMAVKKETNVSRMIREMVAGHLRYYGYLKKN